MFGAIIARRTKSGSFIIRHWHQADHAARNVIRGKPRLTARLLRVALYEHFGLVRLTQLGRGPSWVKA
jgi:hypothetical protein